MDTRREKLEQRLRHCVDSTAPARIERDKMLKHGRDDDEPCEGSFDAKRFLRLL